MATGGEGTDEELGTINEEIAAAFCSLAEVYLTDLWYVTWQRRSARFMNSETGTALIGPALLHFRIPTSSCNEGTRRE